MEGPCYLKIYSHNRRYPKLTDPFIEPTVVEGSRNKADPMIAEVSQSETDPTATEGIRIKPNPMKAANVLSETDTTVAGVSPK